MARTKPTRCAASTADARSAAATTAAPLKPFVKVCGVTTPADAILAAGAGAAYIGMILWPKSKRSIAAIVAKEVATAARNSGAVPVGVFVDESADVIIAACDAAGIEVAQLHGDGARAALSKLPTRIKVIYVVNATAEGVIVTPMPGDEDTLTAQRQKELSGEKGWRAAIDWVHGPRRTVEWILVDGISAVRRLLHEKRVFCHLSRVAYRVAVRAQKAFLTVIRKHFL